MADLGFESRSDGKSSTPNHCVTLLHLWVWIWKLSRNWKPDILEGNRKDIQEKIKAVSTRLDQMTSEVLITGENFLKKNNLKESCQSYSCPEYVQVFIWCHWKITILVSKVLLKFAMTWPLLISAARGLLLLLLLSRFSRVRLCATPWMAAHQAPLPLGFSRQEHWNGLPFPSLMHESEKWKWSRSVISDS